MRGIWFNEFEGSRFVRDAQSLPQAERDTTQVWLEIDDQSLAPARLIRNERLGSAYYIEFEGRETSDMHRLRGDGYGHLGMSEGLVLVDRIQKFRRLKN